jgi:hypothetical protein
VHQLVNEDFDSTYQDALHKCENSMGLFVSASGRKFGDFDAGTRQ